ncbi:hypothetical protein [Actinomadura oligospora]|uniref:hypothetical protein n=1 Tax=Actinomadura oligospora TaxID=111804 RepID=UPI00047DEA2E|nr:hypothetical protein [Actinomadura oligospora]
MIYDLWSARYAVKRAVLDVIADEYHENDTAGAVAQSDYMAEQLDKALATYAEIYMATKGIK